jgi:hypothetical protein
LGRDRSLKGKCGRKIFHEFEKKAVIGMGRLKTTVARARRIKVNRERRCENFAAFECAGHVLRTIDVQSSSGHRLRLEVNDDDEVLECVTCGLPIVVGPDEFMKDLMEEIEACGIEFEVLCETGEVH